MASASVNGPHWRPRLHFTAPSGWINDPNGLVRVGDTWHLHYQYQLPREWGHAVSRNLFHWEHLPVALKPDKHGECWSGCTVHDVHNTSGFFTAGAGGLVSVFTSRDEAKGQRISLAWSEDGGVTWRKFAGNPILRGPTSECRDPKVFWDEPRRHWCMVLTESVKLSFFVSANLREWRRTGEFVPPLRAGVDGYECPDLFELPVENRPGESRWVLASSYLSGANFDGRGGFGTCTQGCWVGRFDGDKFVADAGPAAMLPFGHGPDEYAAIVWPRETAGARRTILIGWMNHWGYSTQIPTGAWQGCLTLPRELRLFETAPGAWQIRQSPAREIWTLPHEATTCPVRTLSAGDAAVALGRARCGVVRFTVKPEADAVLELDLFAAAGRATQVGYNAQPGEVFFDRRESGSPEFHPNFPLRQAAPLTLPAGGALDFTVVFDHSTVEVFAGDGAVYLSGLTFPDPAADGVALRVSAGRAAFGAVELRRIGPPPTIS